MTRDEREGNEMTDLISRAELFNRLSRVPISQYAVDERAKIYEIINEMPTVHESAKDARTANAQNTL